MDDLKPWQRAWRMGFSKVLPTKGLERLRDWLRDDDRRLRQRHTVLTAADSHCVIGGCPLAVAVVPEFGEVGTGLVLIGVVAAQNGADIHCTGASEAFIEFVDRSPRQYMREELLPEIERTLAERLELSPTTVTAVVC